MTRRTRINLTHRSITFAAALAGCALATSLTQTCLAQDVSIEAESTESVDCADCPDGKGTKITYTVTRGDDPVSDDRAADFHVRTTDCDRSNYHCFLIEKWNELDQEWKKVAWTGEFASQKEGNKEVCYVSWYRLASINWLDPGDQMRFSVVYCGPTETLGNSYDFILTNDNSHLPAVPDKNGLRDDVPDVTDRKGDKVDDPEWIGQEQEDAGSKVGWVSSRLDADELHAGDRAPLFVSEATPNAKQFLVYSTSGIGNTYVVDLDVDLSLRRPRLASRTTADDSGFAVHEIVIPDSARGREVWFQNAEYGRASNVIFRVIR